MDRENLFNLFLNWEDNSMASKSDFTVSITAVNQNGTDCPSQVRKSLPTVVTGMTHPTAPFGTKLYGIVLDTSGNYIVPPTTPISPGSWTFNLDTSLLTVDDTVFIGA
jgi:hypothetical protein